MTLGDDFSIPMPLDGRQVSAVCFSMFGVFVRLEFWTKDDRPVLPEYQLAIEATFVLRMGDRELTVAPGAMPPPECVLLMEKTVERSVATARGDLRLEFTDGDVLIVASGGYEPWQISGSDDSLIVSVAGGGLSR